MSSKRLDVRFELKFFIILMGFLTINCAFGTCQLSKEISQHCELAMYDPYAMMLDSEMREDMCRYHSMMLYGLHGYKTSSQSRLKCHFVPAYQAKRNYGISDASQEYSENDRCFIVGHDCASDIRQISQTQCHANGHQDLCQWIEPILQPKSPLLPQISIPKGTQKRT